MPKGKLGIVLLISSGDGKDCCAMNFERTLFRSPKVIKYAKQNFVAYRFDRTFGTGKELSDKYKLEEKKPAVLVLDEDGEVLYKTQRCTNPGVCYLGLRHARVLSAKRQAYAKTYTKTMSEVEKLLEDSSYDRALYKLDRLKPELLQLALREKVKETRESIQKSGTERLDEARALEESKDYDKALEIYRDVARGFRRIETIEDAAKDGIVRVKRLQRDSA